MSVTATELEGLFDVLSREFGSVRNGAKVLAGLACCSARTAENWLQRKCLPSGPALVNLMARCEAVDQEMARLKALARGEGG